MSENRSLEEIDKALVEMGMMPASKMIKGNPFQRHAGIVDIKTFGEWLNMRHEELLRMRAGMEVDGKAESELFEWVMAHHAAFSEVVVNFNAAMEGGAEPPWRKNKA